MKIQEGMIATHRVTNSPFKVVTLAADTSGYVQVTLQNEKRDVYMLALAEVDQVFRDFEFPTEPTREQRQNLIMDWLRGNRAFNTVSIHSIHADILRDYGIDTDPGDIQGLVAELADHGVAIPLAGSGTWRLNLHH